LIFVIIFAVISGLVMTNLVRQFDFGIY